MSICIYDTHGDPCFRSERLDFASWDHMVKYVSENPDLKERIETNWAYIRHAPYSESVMMEAALIMSLLIHGKKDDAE